MLWHCTFVKIALILQLRVIVCYKRNYDVKYTRANIPEWKQKACEKAQKYKANSHYICDDKGDVKCLPGWQGDLCQVPMCRKGCDPMNGYCQRPGECRCRIGYTGELCDKCIALPGCQHGTCTKPFECMCKTGWDGLFCTEPTCRAGCHSTRGYCESPGECRCRIGWAGQTCSECSVMPGCQHGTCNKPLECNCLPGYTGLLCQTPICATECNKQHGYCRKPGECRCKVGWTGTNCDKCFPYPGCVNGDCEKPWECNCQSGWGGMLCDEKLTYCEDNPNICENGGNCISLTKEDGNFTCQCRQGYLGKNCEIIDEFLLTSTAAPRITPPPPPDSWTEHFKRSGTTTVKSITTTTRITNDANTTGAVDDKCSSENVDTTTPTTKTKLKSSTKICSKTKDILKRLDGGHNDIIVVGDDDLKRQNNVLPVRLPNTQTTMENKTTTMDKLVQTELLQQKQQLGSSVDTNKVRETLPFEKLPLRLNVTKANNINETAASVNELNQEVNIDDSNDNDDDDDDDDDDEDEDGEEDDDGDEDDEEDDDDVQLIPNIFNNVGR